MGWWPFGGGASSASGNSGSPTSLPKSEFDEFVPPPPAGGAVAPPPPPKALGAAAVDLNSPFKGFSTPPPAPQVPPTSSPPSSSSSSSTGFSMPSLSVGKTEDYYAKEDFGKYASPYSESPGIYDREYIEEERRRMHGGREASFLDRHVTNPRLRNCLEGVKMGMKMGAAVGGIFGFLTGGYAAVVNRNLLILPVSVVGGAVSFGFFLGCGMVIRCDEPAAVSASSALVANRPRFSFPGGTAHARASPSAARLQAWECKFPTLERRHR
ncbi:conserved hypothetical protein [Neospora caninum Liverpool]|uniref:Reactive oxygen species modulator 1 n=1 Tax=Neospora caninum (strain Liverpool) TaxID=572307 RepID=F0VNZ8_NEOCL|nr:conserved hypothetical protein [Neospora caninum Liverpool]CBZ55444.1 conserved hypothetical protein [Neospora caninum Liverpool]CEL70180.1 TPA: hypothetical protein BN1204_058670 [Neospora caninum Liverpool]|eukprot:XP_003885472.1 conserved hypothetical protein [Neospora caninum Liverpool]